MESPSIDTLPKRADFENPVAMQEFVIANKDKYPEAWSNAAWALVHLWDLERSHAAPLGGLIERCVGALTELTSTHGSLQGSLLSKFAEAAQSFEGRVGAGLRGYAKAWEEHFLGLLHSKFGEHGAAVLEAVGAKLDAHADSVASTLSAHADSVSSKLDAHAGSVLAAVQLPALPSSPELEPAVGSIMDTELEQGKVELEQAASTSAEELLATNDIRALRAAGQQPVEKPAEEPAEPPTEPDPAKPVSSEPVG